MTRASTFRAFVVGAVGIVLSAGLGKGLVRFPSLIVLGVGFLGAVLWGLVRPKSFVLAAIPLITFPTISIAGIPVGLLITFATVAVWVAGMLTGKWSFLARVHFLMLSWALVLVLNVVLSGSMSTLTDRAGDLMTLLGGVFLSAVVVSVRPDPRRTATVMGLTGGLAAFVAQVGGSFSHDRLTALGLGPNYLGIVLAMALVVAFGKALGTGNSAWWIVVVVDVGGLLATQSRGSFIAAAVGLTVLVIQDRRRFAILLLGLFAVTFLFLKSDWDDGRVVGPLLTRPESELRSNNEIRGEAALLSAQVAVQNPVWGIGYGNFPEEAEDKLGVFINTHNDFLRLAAEAGLLGLLPFVFLSMLALKGQTKEMRWTQSVLICYLVACLFANPLSNLQISAMFWTSFGAALASAGSWNRPRAEVKSA